MTKFRWHRGGYEESMATVVPVRSKSELVTIILDSFLFPENHIEIKPYSGIDPRNGWDTHLVSVNGKAVGFTDGPAND